MAEKIYKFSSVASFRNIAILSLLSSILLQASFLYFLSPHLLSFMSLTKNFYALAIFMPISATVIMTFVEAMEDYAEILDNGKDPKYSKMYYFRTFFKYLFIFISMIIIFINAYKFFFSDRSFSDAASNMKPILILIAIYVIMLLWDNILFTAAIIRHDAEKNDVLTSHNLMTVIFFAVSMPIGIGSIWALRTDGADCIVYFDGSNIEAKFIMSLDDISVFKIDNKISTISSSEIKRMDC